MASSTATTNDAAGVLSSPVGAADYQVAKPEGGRREDSHGDVDQPCPAIAGWLEKFLGFVSYPSYVYNQMVEKQNMWTDGKETPRMEAAARGALIPSVDKNGPDYYSAIHQKDDRVDLMLTRSCSENYKLEVAVMASKIAYENATVSKKFVENNLKGRHFEFFNCLNVILDRRSTQAIGFVRKENGTDIVYVAFRGSDLEASDWRVNLDCSLVEIGGEFGSVHVGFMKALGFIENEGSFDDRFPSDLPDPRWVDPPAYYAVRQWLTCTVARLKESPAGAVGPTLRVVGHSQGGALAILFAFMLRYHNLTSTTIPVSKIEVITLGQPRVGNGKFAEYMTTRVIGSSTDFAYTRMVFSYDIVARMPSDERSTKPTYRHFGTCLYYQDWFTKTELTDDAQMPYLNIPWGVEIGRFGSTLENAMKALRDQASKSAVLLQEPATAIAHRQKNLSLLQYHFPGEYLNAARHGESQRQRSSLHTLLQFLLHPISFCKFSRRRVLITGDDDVP